MNSNNYNIKIATILPYKENYTFSKAQAAAIWVADFFKHSKFKKNNYIFGNTIKKDYLTNNYINIPISKKKSRFSSTTSEYCDNIVKIINERNFDIVEIHNRPLVFKILKKSLSGKFILYFHNDPLNMKGSKTIAERLYLLDNVDKIIFVSKWTQRQFFQDIDEKLIHKTDIVYPSIHKAKKIYKKYKSIVFIGKLNESKGYDFFKESITKILDNHKDWKAYSIGDESRERPHIKHKRHIELGFLKHKKVLNFLGKTEIAVVPSIWEEPFGRTALESSSRACATIISNRGGLPETTDYSLVLKKLNANELFKKIDFLIKNNEFRKKLQKNGFLNVKHVTKNNSNLIDEIRSKLIHNFSLTSGIGWK